MLTDAAPPTGADTPTPTPVPPRPPPTPKPPMPTLKLGPGETTVALGARFALSSACAPAARAAASSAVFDCGGGSIAAGGGAITGTAPNDFAFAASLSAQISRSVVSGAWHTT